MRITKARTSLKVSFMKSERILHLESFVEWFEERFVYFVWSCVREWKKCGYDTFFYQTCNIKSESLRIYTLCDKLCIFCTSSGWITKYKFSWQKISLDRSKNWLFLKREKERGYLWYFFFFLFLILFLFLCWGRNRGSGRSDGCDPWCCF